VKLNEVCSTHIRKKSITSGDNGEAPETIKRTLPPSLAFILLNTNLSQIGDGFFPGKVNMNLQYITAKRDHVSPLSS